MEQLKEALNPNLCVTWCSHLAAYKEILTYVTKALLWRLNNT